MPPPFEGRGDFPGPLRGSYVFFTGIIADLAAADIIVHRFACPCDLRIMEFSVVAMAINDTPTVKLDGGTVGGANIVPVADLAAAGTALIITPTSTPGLIAAQRDQSKGNLLEVTFVTVDAETFADVSFTIACYTTSHVVALSDDD